MFDWHCPGTPSAASSRCSLVPDWSVVCCSWLGSNLLLLRKSVTGIPSAVYAHVLRAPCERFGWVSFLLAFVGCRVYDSSGLGTLSSLEKVFKLWIRRCAAVASRAYNARTHLLDSLKLKSLAQTLTKLHGTSGVQHGAHSPADAPLLTREICSMFQKMSPH